MLAFKSFGTDETTGLEREIRINKSTVTDQGIVYEYDEILLFPKGEGFTITGSGSWVQPMDKDYYTRIIKTAQDKLNLVEKFDSRNEILK